MTTDKAQVIEQRIETVGGVTYSEPVGSKTFLFDVEFPSPSLDAEDLQEAIDISLVEARQHEPRRSMEEVFADLDIK